MDTTNKDRPAFPTNHDNSIVPDHGMTMREYYAGMAMQALVSANNLRQTIVLDDTSENAWPRRVAKISMVYADALIAELNK